MSTLNFQLVTPEKTVLNEELSSLSCLTTLGQITILPGHVPLVATLVPGELHAKSETEEHYIYVAGGFVEVRDGRHVVVLADAAEHNYEINLELTEAAKQQGEKDMAEKRMSSEEYAKVSAILQQNLAKLNIARKHAHRKNPLSGQGTFEE